MLSNESPYQERFNKLLEQLRGEINSLKGQITKLKKENNRLRSELEDIQDGKADIYAEISESERLALRHQILGLISKIDHHLDNGK